MRVIEAIGVKSELAVTSYLLSFWLNREDIIERMEAVLRLFDIANTCKNCSIKRLKQFHDIVRKFGLMPDGEQVDLHVNVRLQYMQDLFNRDTYNVDFTSELEQRQIIAPLLKRHPFDEDEIQEEHLRFVIRQVIEPLRKRDVEPLSSFALDAVQWMAQGSAPNLKVSVEHGGKDWKLQSTKKLLSEYIDIDVIEKWLDLKLFSTSSVTTKFENGKNRALMGGSEAEYVMQSYLLHRAEDALGGHMGMLFKLGGVGSVEAKMDIVARLKELRVVWSYDFKNFQMNHSLRTMRIVWEEVINLRTQKAIASGDMQAARDTQRVGAWVIGALHNTYLQDVATGITIKNRHGLPTGVRATALMNTVLNKVYDILASQLAKTLAPGNYGEGYHMGDDIMKPLQTMSQAAVMNRCMSSIGLAGSDIKLLIEKGGGELLGYRYVMDNIFGYLNRTVASTVSGEYDIGDRSNPLAMAAAIPAVCGKLVERGVDRGKAAQLERFFLLSKHAKMWLNGENISINVANLAASTLNGGCGAYTLTLGAPKTDLAGGLPTVPPLRNDALAEQVSGRGSLNMISKIAYAYPLLEGKDLSEIRTQITNDNLARSWPKPVIDAWYEELGSVCKSVGDVQKLPTKTSLSACNHEVVGRVKRVAERFKHGESVYVDESSLARLIGSWAKHHPANLVAFAKNLDRGIEKGHHMLDTLVSMAHPTNSGLGESIPCIKNWVVSLGEEVTRQLMLSEVKFDRMVDIAEPM